MKVKVITISDRASRGVYADESGPEIARIIREAYPDAEISITVVPDERTRILAAFEDSADAGFIITTGGTGIGPRDITPEATREWCRMELPGIAETLRAESYRETPQAMLSRGTAGLKGNTIVINFPGSVKAVRLCAKTVLPILGHAGEMLSGGGH
ncbi:MAG: MogA/MoaB family molybdenum cofactor biosynthesis protein [Spirochaetales bacterium]|nr:MAG: MogA/MoaB family molybdenum cofactor biosynthesis protein [Spirochaetales bacterium]